MELVFYKRISREGFQLGGEGNVILRVPFDSAKIAPERMSESAPQLFLDHFGEPFNPNEGYYYKIE